MAHARPPQRVLVVDDDPKVVALLARSLKKLGEQYLIETACCGEEALSKIQEHAYAVVITDYVMPGLSGLDVAQLVRQHSPDTPVLLLTGHGTHELRDSAERLHLEYIDKPFEIAQVLAAVRHAIEHTSGERVPAPDQRLLTQRVYDDLHALQTNIGARCVLLVRRDGYILDAVGQTYGLDLVSTGALVAGSFVAVIELARVLGNRSVFKSSYHEGPDYNIYAYGVDEETILAVIFGPECKPGVVWFYAKQTATALAPLLAGPSPASETVGDVAAAVRAELDRLWG